MGVGIQYKGNKDVKLNNSHFGPHQGEAKSKWDFLLREGSKKYRRKIKN